MTENDRPAQNRRHPSKRGVAWPEEECPLLTHGEALYAAGYFTTAGGITVDHIAKWDGVQWSALTGPSGTGLSAGALALAVYDDGGGEALFVGGYFHTVGGVAVNIIAKWDGTQWSAIGTGVSDGGTVYTLAVYDDGNGEALYVGGSFVIFGDAMFLAKWDGTQWSPIPPMIPDGEKRNSKAMGGYVAALGVYDDGSGEALYVGGFAVDGIAKWDGTEWSELSGPFGIGMDDDVLALRVYDDGSGEALYAGGRFVTGHGERDSEVERYAVVPSVRVLWHRSGWFGS